MTLNATKEIAKRLSQAVEATEPRITRAELAKRLKLTPGAVSHYLNGVRPCPTDVIKRIARITKTEPGWLLRGVTADTNVSTSSSRTTRAKTTSLTWRFREAPPDGGKDFGNAAIYAVPMAVRTIVREDGQNSLDAAYSSEVVLRFRIVELSPSTERYSRVLRALRLDQLKERIDAIENADEFESKLGAKLSTGLENILKQQLVLVYVDDYGARGLQGAEFDSTQPYCALVRDNLNSRKDTNTAGGVFGLGAKVNTACSQIGTVLFASKVRGEESRGTRLIGRTEMTYHEIKDGGTPRRYAGPGWFGEPNDRLGTVESAWLSDDDQILSDLMLRRDELPRGVRPIDACGTSILISAFSDPQTESSGSTQHLADAFIEAAAVNFWPAIMRGSLTVWVERYVDDDPDPVKSDQVDPRSVAGVAELCDAWEKHLTGRTTPVMSAAGDVAVATVPLSIPATKPRVKGLRPHGEIVSDCTLVVRLAEPDVVASDPRVGQIAFVRGRAMVTRYQTRSSVAAGRPFHAMLLAGTLVGRSAEQVAAEQFLRIAEPPAHDKWTYNADLGERYARGGKKSLDEFLSRVTEELQRLLRPPISRSSDGPEVLKRLLQLRLPKQTLVTQPQVRILRSSARVVSDSWHITAEVSINPTPRILNVTPRLSFRCEGSPAVPVAWKSITTDDDTVTVIGQSLLLKPRTKRVTFEAWSDPSSHPVNARESSALLDVVARVEVEQ